MSPFWRELFGALYYSTLVVIALAMLEAIVLTLLRKEAYNWRGALASIADALGREYLVNRFLTLSLAGPVIAFAYAHRLTQLNINSSLAFGLLFLGVDFCYYWLHRASHRIRWFWITHAIHHSSNELNLGAAYRFGWTGRITGSSVFLAPLIWLGFPPGAVFGVLSLNLLYQFWIHATWIPKLGWLEYVVNTPSHHRVHHAANPEYLDANYGGILILWDRLFGTWIGERAELPCRYGLVKPLRSNNPLVINSFEWVALGRDLWRARTMRERAMYIFGPPGWRPDGQGWTTQDLRRASPAIAAE
jgi:sterol desaturase/sphingolipid hydroxylase (fatty acid hydroxylase superfamily)